MSVIQFYPFDDKIGMTYACFTVITSY